MSSLCLPPYSLLSTPLSVLMGLGFLSDNHLNQIQNNTVFPTQKEVDRVVGFEPTTSANSNNKHSIAGNN
jgi:hypothetical protein